ncbi:MAG: hypothetical protein RLZZ501_1227, partial [Pseudomonadota bacterium]
AGPAAAGGRFLLGPAGRVNLFFSPPPESPEQRGRRFYFGTEPRVNRFFTPPV